ncbi:hypothetical protein J3Q64DRAFT_1827953 [Phycomyces blakesleeanus]|uniref:Uncharacterized protein n=1 Tax=Phycomyces blakesleeanus TaxID=4837 RepID=A0ABR3BDE0_PHYBL
MKRTAWYPNSQRKRTIFTTASGSNNAVVEVLSSSSAEETSRKAQKDKQKVLTGERGQWDTARDIAIMQSIYDRHLFANYHGNNSHKYSFLISNLQLFFLKTSSKLQPTQQLPPLLPPTFAKEDCSEDFLFSLPLKYIPGTDLMSKLILNNDEVIKIIVSTLFGVDACRKYSTRPKEWPNFKRSDVLYCPFNRKEFKNHPPILIEVQYYTGMNFFRRLMKYSLSVCKYYSTLPIVLTIVTNNISQALADQAYECPEFPYAKNLPCTGRTKACFMINKQTITNHLKSKPLEAMVALAHFLIEGKSALINIDRRDDQTIQTLYRIAKNIIFPEIEKEETNSAAFEKLYFCAFNGFNRTKEILLENQALNEIHRKRFAATSSDPTGTITPDQDTALTTISSETNVVSTSSPVNVSTMPKENDTTLTQSASSSAAIMPNASTVSVPISTSGTTRDLKRRMQQKNWKFINAYRTEHGSNMDWEQCFVQGKGKGLSTIYKSQEYESSIFSGYIKDFKSDGSGEVRLKNENLTSGMKGWDVRWYNNLRICAKPTSLPTDRLLRSEPENSLTILQTLYFD